MATKRTMLASKMVTEAVRYWGRAVNGIKKNIGSSTRLIPSMYLPKNTLVGTSVPVQTVDLRLVWGMDGWDAD